MIEFTGLVSVNPILGRQAGRSLTIVCEAAGQKADSAAKRARQAEKRRLYNKSRKSEIRTRMKKVFYSQISLNIDTIFKINSTGV